ncbi:MAG: tetratricopeptide repeat protein [Bacteroidota bacterium]
MTHEDEAKEKELARKRLIEEIKKRAEEAELNRIEEDEQRVAPSKPREAEPQPQSPPVSSRSEPLPSPSFPPPSTAEQRVTDLRERLLMALDRGLADKAGVLFSELNELIPNDPELRTYQFRLAVLQENQQEVKLKKKSGGKKDEQTKLRGERETRKQEITKLLEDINALYQNEKYEKALTKVDQILEIDSEHGEALELMEKIERAKDLAEEIRQEEARRKATEAETAPPVVPPIPKKEEKGDPWGSTPIITQSQTVFDDPAEKTVAAPRKRELVLGRVVGWVSRIRIPVKTIATVLVVAVLGVVAYMVVDTVRSTVFPAKHSLLIFPATSALADGSTDYLTEGLTVDIIGDFTIIPDMRLIAPVTALQFGDPRSHNAQTAKATGVSIFLVWSVASENGETTVQASLYDTSNASPVWSFQQRVASRELPSLRLELGRNIVTQMGVVLPAEIEEVFSEKPVVDMQAYDAYLRGDFALRNREQAINDAIALFELARIADSTYAPIHNALGWSHLLAYEQGDTAAVHLVSAQRAVQHAVALNPRSGITSRVWGMLDHFQGDHAKALQRLEESVHIAPADAESQRRYGYLLTVAGQAEEALKIADGAASIDPRNIESHTLTGLIHLYRAEFQEVGQENQREEFRAALRSFETGLRLAEDKSAYASTYNADVLVYVQQHERATEILTDRVARVRDSFLDFYRLGRVLQSAGKPVQQWQLHFQRAKQLLLTLLKTNPEDGVALSFLALVHTRLGEFKDASSASERALSVARSNTAVLYNIARMHALQKNKEEALTTLSSAIGKYYDLTAILDMDFFNLRQDPDFIQAIVP